MEKIKKVPAPLAIAVLVALIYSNVFGAPFIFDDIKYIVENGFIRELANFYSLSGTRYLTFLSFALNYAVGGLSPWGYHFVNIALHALNSIMLYLLVRGLFDAFASCLEDGGEPGHGGQGLARYLAFMTALVFAAHPMETEAVSYVSQRFVSLAAFFYLLSIICYIRSRLAFITRKMRRAIVLYLVAFIAGILAQKSKEIAFTLPALIILVEFLFFQQGRILFKKGIFAAPFLALFAIIPLELFAFGGAGGGPGGIAGKVRLLQLEELATLSRHDYLITQFRVLITYLRLLFFPLGQRGDYDYTIYHRFFSLPVLLSFMVLLLIFAFAIYTALRSARKGRIFGLLFGFGLLWFFITISVESSIVPIKDLIFEHRVYLPSAGVFLSVISLYLAFFGHPSKSPRGKRKKSSLAVFIFPLVVVLVLSALTYRRNRVWGSNLAFWTDIVHKSPTKARAYNNLGNSYYNRGEIKKAIGNYRQAIALKGDDYEAYNNLGSALLAKGRPDLALGYFRRAIELRPDYAGAMADMALALLLLNRPGEAIGYARAALALRPELATAHNALGMALADKGNMEEGIQHLREALRLNPASGDFANNLGLALLRAGRTEEAIIAMKKAVALEPDNRKYVGNLNMARKAFRFLLEKRKLGKENQ